MHGGLEDVHMAKKARGAGNHGPETPGNGIRSKVAVASED